MGNCAGSAEQRRSRRIDEELAREKIENERVLQFHLCDRGELYYLSMNGIRSWDEVRMCLVCHVFNLHGCRRRPPVNEAVTQTVLG